MSGRLLHAKFQHISATSRLCRTTNLKIVLRSKPNADVGLCTVRILSVIKRGKDMNKKRLEMWANAQPDGRPAEYRWRRLFNAAKFS